ncbi:ABC transporter ATP-binding protein [Heyndrickxia camelliae]|uniref:Dipeptide/oligopeptide/nickel ABC transporter ATP-binding protein n=1 Tax=Heyndrickxia camelliae TaxID=1707093 RepID=A0A2N3LCM7_9BACI|nr:ABC transporter ATP-binding protein [Heyndrickxia camelliae]PKR82378.1 dipeptide/oligopeptide/nickel ABC transporter ATP-binding protein [Heyndrickxia camelliae]
MENQPLLQLQNLRTSFRIQDDYYAAVDDVTLTVNENEVVAIVGESGCGKSALALSVMGLHPLDRTKLDGNVNFNGRNLLSLSTGEMNKIRGKDIGMIFQDPLTALNPLMTCGKQIEESMNYHTKLSGSEIKAKTLELLKKVGIPNPERTYKQYPHELSGGMRQRVVIAIAISCEPSLVIADEPTTALDVTIQAQIMDLLKDLQKQMKTGIILITHDLGVVAEMADKVAVMYAGEIVELADVNTLFKNPLHPYTRSLLNSIPSTNTAKGRLHVIQGIVPSLQKLPRKGCRFKGRINWVPDHEHEENPVLREVEPNHFVRCTCYKNFEFPQSDIGEINYDIS